MDTCHHLRHCLRQGLWWCAPIYIVSQEFLVFCLESSCREHWECSHLWVLLLYRFWASNHILWGLYGKCFTNCTIPQYQRWTSLSFQIIWEFWHVHGFASFKTTWQEDSIAEETTPHTWLRIWRYQYLVLMWKLTHFMFNQKERKTSSVLLNDKHLELLKWLDLKTFYWDKYNRSKRPST